MCGSNATRRYRDCEGALAKAHIVKAAGNECGVPLLCFVSSGVQNFTGQGEWRDEGMPGGAKLIICKNPLLQVLGETMSRWDSLSPPVLGKE